MGGSGNQIDHKAVHETDDLKMEYIHHKQWLRILSNTELLNEHYRWLMQNDNSVAIITRGLGSVGCPDIRLGLVASLAHALKVLQIEREKRAFDAIIVSNLLRDRDPGEVDDLPELTEAMKAKMHSLPEGLVNKLWAMAPEYAEHRRMMNWMTAVENEEAMRLQAQNFGLTEEEYRKALRSKLGQGQSSGASDGTGTSSTPPPESSGPSESESPPSSQPELQQ